MRTLSLLLALFLLLPALAFAQADLIEAVSATYAGSQPQLESYQADLKTDKINEMIARMTANMPPDMPRPSEPQLVKFWRRGIGSAVRSRGPVMPNMQQMIDRFSEQFSLDLDRFFFPVDQAEKRALLLKRAHLKDSDTQIGSETLHSVELTFDQPAIISGAFYGTGLDLPHDGITRLEFEIDPAKKILRQMVIEAEGWPQLTIAIRHSEFNGESFPADIRVTSLDGKIDQHFVTTLQQVSGFYLPSSQVREIRRPGVDEKMRVDFLNYKVTRAEAAR